MADANYTELINDGVWNYKNILQIHGKTLEDKFYAPFRKDGTPWPADTKAADMYYYDFAGSTVSFGHLNDKILTEVQAREFALKQSLTELGPNPSTLDLLLLQQKTQEWSMLIDLQATMTKTLSETMRGIIQKLG